MVSDLFNDSQLASRDSLALVPPPETLDLLPNLAHGTPQSPGTVRPRSGVLQTQNWPLLHPPQCWGVKLGAA